MMASNVPVERPPEDLKAGVERSWVERNYGYPLAFDINDAGGVVEQIQFVDGVPKDDKRFRVVLHTSLDYCTLCIWEIIGTPFELCMQAGGYPTYVYFLEYDDGGKLVRAVDSNSQDGIRYRGQQWTVPEKEGLEFNESPAVHNAIVDALSRKAFEAGETDLKTPPKKVVSAAGAGGNRHVPASTAREMPYKVVHFSRRSGNGLSYHFILDVTAQERSLSVFKEIRREFAKEIIDDYAETFSVRDVSSLHADFVDFRLDGSRLEGDAVVMSVTPVALVDYDAKSCKGKITVRFNTFVDREYARKWAVRNIELLVRDKNIHLTAGEIPPNGEYVSLNESWRENELEISFMAF
jgi:hypothetical protein